MALGTGGTQEYNPNQIRILNVSNQKTIIRLAPANDGETPPAAPQIKESWTTS